MGRWFGDPWPSAERRADVCDDDANRVPVPVGEPCAQCHVLIQDTDRGVVLPGLDEDHEPYESYWHLRCLLMTTLGEPMADTVLARMED